MTTEKSIGPEILQHPAYILCHLRCAGITKIVYLKLLSAASLFTRGYHSSSSAYLIWHIFTLNALPYATPIILVSPAVIQPGIFCFVGECVHYYTLKVVYLQSKLFFNSFFLSH